MTDPEIKLEQAIRDIREADAKIEEGRRWAYVQVRRPELRSLLSAAEEALALREEIERGNAAIEAALKRLAMSEPIPMLLWCPACGRRHIDMAEFATKEHHTHACQHCGMVWRPAIVPTVGVEFLPGFKDRAP